MKTTLIILFVLLAGLVSFAQDDSDTPVVNCASAAKIDEFKFTSINDMRET